MEMVTLRNNNPREFAGHLPFPTSYAVAEIFVGNRHLPQERKVTAALQRLRDQFGMPELVARFGKFGYGIFAFDALTTETLRRITEKFIKDKLEQFRHPRDGVIRGPALEITGYPPELVDTMLLEADTVRNGARELRDIVERTLNAAYDEAAGRISGDRMTGRLDIDGQGKARVATEQGGHS